MVSVYVGGGNELVDAHASSRETHEPTEQEMKEELAVSWLNVLIVS